MRQVIVCGRERDCYLLGGGIHAIFLEGLGKGQVIVDVVEKARLDFPPVLHIVLAPTYGLGVRDEGALMLELGGSSENNAYGLSGPSTHNAVHKFGPGHCDTLHGTSLVNLQLGNGNEGRNVLGVFVPVYENRIVTDDAHSLGRNRGEAEEELSVVRLYEDRIALRKGRAYAAVNVHPLAAAIQHLDSHIGVPSSELFETTVAESEHINGLRLVPGVAEVVLLRCEGLFGKGIEG